MRIMTAKLESLKGTLGKIMGPSPLIHSMNLKHLKINTESGNIHLENNLFLPISSPMMIQVIGYLFDID